MDTSIWAYPFDLLDGGVEETLAEIGDLGVGGVSVAATYHAGRLLLPHNPKRAVLSLEDGVAYFRPETARYETLSLRPEASDYGGEGDPFREIAEAAARRGLALGAWTVCLHNSRLGRANPECTIRNAFGEPYSYALCPANPECRAYALALGEEIAARYAPAALELEAFGYMGYDHASHHEKIAFPLDGARNFLLSVCFCAHCGERMRGRGVDPEALAGAFRGELRAYFEAGVPTVPDEPGDIEAFLAARIGGDPLRGLLAAREEAVASLLGELRRRVPRKVALHCMASPSRFASGAAVGAILGALRPFADAFILNLFTPDLASLRSEVRRARASAGPGVRLFANLRVHAPDSEGEGEFLEKVALLREEGIDGFRFYHYGLLPRARLAWVRKAIGFLR